MWLYMHGGSCVDCHGTNGKGGVPVMMGTAIPADLTNLYATHSHGDGKMVMVPYTNDLLKRAITKGINANGESLDPTMPRWYMPEKDSNDLVAYIKTLQAEDHHSSQSKAH
jgi:mono/diheme cytochrome c family protein